MGTGDPGRNPLGTGDLGRNPLGTGFSGVAQRWMLGVQSVRCINCGSDRQAECRLELNRFLLVVNLLYWAEGFWT